MDNKEVVDIMRGVYPNSKEHMYIQHMIPILILNDFNLLFTFLPIYIVCTLL